MNYRKDLRAILAHIWPFNCFISRLDCLYSEVTQLQERLDCMNEELNARLLQLQKSNFENRSLNTYNDLMRQELTESYTNNYLLTEKNATLQDEIRALSSEKKEIQRVNVLLKKQLDVHNNFHKIGSSSAFWEEIYANGGNSGTGSYNRLAKFKAEVVNTFLKEQGVLTTIEFGCGDGSQLSLINYPNYVGVDVSSNIIEKNKIKFINDRKKTFYCTFTERDKYINQKYDLSISMDVIFHLLEEDVFSNYMNDLFSVSKRYVIIYSSNHEEYTKWPEYRHRKFMRYIQENIKGWILKQFIPNKYPYVIGREEVTSASDFYIFERIL
ncbi:hypothetical protein EDD70_2886 [Hydrogenoanaerobacterium saccharovorans]|uniref:Methyltransferase domain-containing protein n=1 Tax=Hydrogenoanaerobacterium saccharovorans TaxID=474960 RepID=A0A1H8EEU0_9FIRM|nr:hypothetical protein [Hydrogenoanaerobacterium saccharovorans]RPF42143.1 hypothetical protein EDD70_2886 [Hydrogenoanaerobacterium saccharovorans]SEN18049.1 hypothetical protein SAMN05216180_2996 [Hydrogenoanaerobacterium saccharovorans]